MNIAPNNPTTQDGGTKSSPEAKVPAGSNVNYAATFDDDLNKEYIDERTVTISLVHNYSNYRRANMKVLGQRKETIGSSVRSCQVLSSNAQEVAAYFPALIGLSPNNPDFVTRVKAWLSNIQFTISENDVSLDTSFIYNKKADYLKIKEQEDAKKIFDLIASHISTRSVVIHCSHGKDRTGIISALILGICGVSDNDIVNNYIVNCQF